MNENIKNLITAIAEGDSIAIESSFNTVMAHKISERLDSMKIDVAGTMFSESVVEEELSLEDYSVEELEDFMMSEDYEQLDELSKATLGSYITRASADAGTQRRSAGVQLGAGASKDKEKYEKHEDKADSRLAGIRRAVSKLTK